MTNDPQVDNAKALKVADEEAMHHEAMKVEGGENKDGSIRRSWILLTVFNHAGSMGIIVFIYIFFCSYTFGGFFIGKM